MVREIPRQRSPLQFLVKYSALLLLLGVLGLLTLTIAVHRAASADVVVGFVNDDRIQLTEEQVVSSVFRNQQNASAARKSAENALEVQVDFVALIGTLTVSQREKLELAGQGDIARFFDEFDAFLRAAPLGPITQDQWQQFWQNVNPLQTRYSAGLHGKNSLFRKTIPCALEAEQLTVFQKLEEDRRRQHYRALVEATLAAIDGQIPLTAKQREQILEVVLTKTEPPRSYGQSYYQYHFVLLQMSQIQNELKPLFLENEWPVMEGILRQGRSVERMFREILKEDAE